MIKTAWATIKRNPARSYSVLLAAIAVAASFGLNLTADQLGAVTAFLALTFGQAVHSQVSLAE